MAWAPAAPVASGSRGSWGAASESWQITSRRRLTDGRPQPEGVQPGGSFSAGVGFFALVQPHPSWLDDPEMAIRAGKRN